MINRAHYAFKNKWKSLPVWRRGAIMFEAFVPPTAQASLLVSHAKGVVTYRAYVGSETVPYALKYKTKKNKIVFMGPRTPRIGMRKIFWRTNNEPEGIHLHPDDELVDVFDAIEISWYADGGAKSVTTRPDQHGHSVSVQWRSDGSVSSTANYKNGERHGPRTEYKPNVAPTLTYKFQGNIVSAQMFHALSILPEIVKQLRELNTKLSEAQYLPMPDHPDEQLLHILNLAKAANTQFDNHVN